jgi:ribosomal protein S18 acetylase RimI-like enzyme
MQIHQRNSKISTEVAVLQDCRAIAEVHVESWQQAYQGILPADYLASLSIVEREVMWCELILRSQSALLVARSELGDILGFVAFGASRDTDASDDCAEIWAIYVKPAYWSLGVGRLLSLAALQQLRSERFKAVSLWVLADNQRAISFYIKAGFVAEPKSEKLFELGGTMLKELRFVRPLTV